jgi:hypothetical protein
MLHVVALNELGISVTHWEVVSSVMGYIVNEIAKDKSGKYRCHPLPCLEEHGKNKVEQPIENDCEGNRHHGRHYQAGFTLGLSMVHAVKKEDNPLSSFTLDLHMEQEAVKEVLRKGPEEQAKDEAKWNVKRKGSSGSLKDGANKEKE